MKYLPDRYKLTGSKSLITIKYDLCSLKLAVLSVITALFSY